MDLFHLLLGRSVFLFTLICAVWGILAHFGRLPNDGRYYSTLVLAELLLIAQAALGVILLLAGRVPADPLHIVYGVVAALALPAAYSFVGQRGGSRALASGLAMLFVCGLALRAFTTSPVGLAGLLGATGR